MGIIKIDGLLLMGVIKMDCLGVRGLVVELRDEDVGQTRAAE